MVSKRSRSIQTGTRIGGFLGLRHMHLRAFDDLGSTFGVTPTRCLPTFVAEQFCDSLLLLPPDVNEIIAAQARTARYHLPTTYQPY